MDEYACQFCGEVFDRPENACQSLGSAETCPNGHGLREVKPDSATDPIHYARWEIEPIDFIRENGLDFCTGNVIKYLLRHSYKNGREDLEKAKVYIDFIIEQEYGE